MSAHPAGGGSGTRHADLPAALPDYAELLCRSNFSFLHGASHAEELLARAAELGYQALAITDECSLAGLVCAYEEAKRQRELHEQRQAPRKLLPITLLIGSVFTLSAIEGEPAHHAACRLLLLLLLARTLTGYTELCALITRARGRSTKGSYRLDAQDFQPDDAGRRPITDCWALLLPRREDAADT